MYGKIHSTAKSNSINKQIKAEVARYNKFCYMLHDDNPSEETEKQIRSQMEYCLLFIDSLCRELSRAHIEEMDAFRRNVLREGEEDDSY